MLSPAVVFWHEALQTALPSTLPCRIIEAQFASMKPLQNFPHSFRHKALLN
ncbi:MAG: hypothetical protein IKH13_07675 [Clostridia bacterium]|nr:hypothetical protein [Clostridia bacterium]